MQKIIVCGGGNGAHLFAVLAKGFVGSKGVVGIYAPYKDEAKTIKEAMDKNGGIEAVFSNSVIKEKIDIVSKFPFICKDADLIVLIAPAFTHEKIIREIAPFISENSILGAIPARSGFEFSVPAILNENNISNVTLFAGQTLPWACRLELPGKRVKAIGTKDKIGVATIPPSQASNVAKILSNLSFVNFYPVDNMLSISLGNVGQIVHPGIMYGLFKNFDGTPYFEAPLFYQGMNKEIAFILEQMSGEILEIKQKINRQYPNLDLCEVRSLKDWLLETYGSLIRDKSSLVSAFITNKGYNGLKAPMIKQDEGYIPDFSSRYLTEDVPTGLVVTKAIAVLCDINTPMIDKVLSTVSKWIGKEYLISGKLEGADVPSTRIPNNYGIYDMEGLVSCIKG